MITVFCEIFFNIQEKCFHGYKTGYIQKIVINYNTPSIRENGFRQWGYRGGVKSVYMYFCAF